MKYEQAHLIAKNVLAQLEPHCYKCEIAGSIRRCKSDVKDIEIVCIPKPYDVKLFEYGLATVVDRWKKVRGNLGKDCKYTQRILPEGIKLDLFIVNELNWGYQFALRTGSVEFTTSRLLPGWKRRGFEGRNGYLTFCDEIIPVRTEEEMFDYCDVEYVEPFFR